MRLRFAGIGLQRALLGAVVLALASCSADKPKPTPLEAFQPKIAVSQVWTTRVGSIGFPMIPAERDGVF